MPNFASSVTLNDGQASPVAHTFAPLSLVGTEARHVDRSSGISVGYPILTTAVTLPTKQQKMTKIRLKLAVPVMEVVNSSTYSGITPAPTKAYDVTFDGTFFLPERSTLSARKDLLAYVKNLVAHANTAALVETQETYY